MKVTIVLLIAALLASSLNYAQASTSEIEGQPEQALELSLNDLSAEQLAEVEAIQSGHQFSSRDEKVARVIGGIIGGIAAGAIANRGGYGPYYPYPQPHQQGVVCYAQNKRGHVFQGFGRHWQMAQHRALQNCYSQSRFCQVIQCRQAGGRW